MSSQRPVLLVVDDEPFYHTIIVEYLADLDYEIVVAGGGEEAWAKFCAEPQKYDAILLDRMMPKTDGMEVLRRIRQDVTLKFLPVILETAACVPEQIAEGLTAGAFYYLTKPFTSEVLRAVISNALRDRFDHIVETHDAETKKLALNYLDGAHFTFRTTEAARQIAALVSCVCPSSQSAYVGLMELMLNAVEHGNLGITYDEKSQFISENRLQTEIERRLYLPEYAHKVASLDYRRGSEAHIFTIQDAGNGFDWEPYLEMSMERMMDNHGRGIAMSRSLTFSRLEYLGNGNHLQATIGH